MEPCIGYFINGGKPVLNGIREFDIINRTINQAGGFRCLQTMPAGNYATATFTHANTTAIVQSGWGAAILSNPGAALVLGCILGACIFAAYTYLNRPQTINHQGQATGYDVNHNRAFNDLHILVDDITTKIRNSPRKAKQDYLNGGGYHGK